MIFTKLTLKNFKSHIDTEIDFKKGTTIILGDNGAGKSSIFEGINFALYKKYNTKSLNDLINTQAESMSVSLSFLVGNKEYKVKRTRSGKKSTAELSVLQDGKYNSIVSGDKEVNNYIEELLQIDADLFLNAIYIKQGEIDSLVTQKASERKKNISRLLRLDNLEVSYKNMANVISNYELKKGQLNSLIDNTFQDNKEELVQRQDELKKQLGAKNQELASLQTEIKNIKEEISEQNVLSVTYQQLKNKRAVLDTQSRSLSDNMDDLREQIQELKEAEQILESLKTDIDNINFVQELSRQIFDKNETLSHIQSIEKKIYDNLRKIAFVDDISKVYQNDVLNKEFALVEQIDRLGKLIDTDCLENKKAIKNVQQQTQQMIIETTKLKTIVEDNKQLLKEVQDIQGICPICQSVLDAEHKEKLINNYNNIINDNSLKLEKRNQELQVLQKEENSLNDMLKEKMDFLNKVQNASIVAQLIDDDMSKKIESETYLSTMKEKINNHMKLLDIDDENSVEALYHDLIDKQQKYQEAEFNLKNKQDIQEKYDNVKMEYHKVITDLKEIDDRIRYLNFDSDLLQKYQAEQSSLQNKYYPLVKEISQIENEIKYNQNQIENIDNKIKQNKENKEKVQKLDEFVKFLKDVRELYSKDGLQKDIRLVFKPQIERYTQDFFNKFDFDYSSLKLSDDYDIIITGPSGDSDVSMASGGEKIAIALALRLGIAQAVTANTIETILLDEPTTYLDVIRKQEFINIIQNISLTPQMIIITHDIELENAANNIIVVEKNNGQSVIS